MWFFKKKKKDKKGQKMLQKGKKSKIFENLGNNVKIWKYFEKGLVLKCDYHMQ